MTVCVYANSREKGINLNYKFSNASLSFCLNEVTP